MIEVYPRAALIAFPGAPERLPYKAGKTTTCWPGLAPAARAQKMRATWARIVETLERRIEGAAAALPIPGPEARGWRLKAFEDKLDAVVCAAVAIAALDGEADAVTGFDGAGGAADGAIWVPRVRR